MHATVRSAVCRFIFPLFVSLATAIPAPAAEFPCVGTTVDIEGGDERDRRAACDAVREGMAFLETVGISLGEQIRLILVSRAPATSSEDAIGSYDPRRGEITMLEYAAALDGSRRCATPFGHPFSLTLWRSYVVHEVAHAAAHRQFAHRVPHMLASEYIASVAQMATLTPHQRERLFTVYPELSGFEHAAEISFGYYLLDPGRFTVNAYLHYMRPENGREFIARLLREGLPQE